MIYPGVEFKSIECDALFADADFNEIRLNLGVEAIAVHTQITGRIVEADQSGDDRIEVLHVRCRCAGYPQGFDDSFVVARKPARKITVRARLSTVDSEASVMPWKKRPRHYQRSAVVTRPLSGPKCVRRLNIPEGHANAGRMMA